MACVKGAPLSQQLAGSMVLESALVGRVQESLLDVKSGKPSVGRGPMRVRVAGPIVREGDEQEVLSVYHSVEA